MMVLVVEGTFSRAYRTLLLTGPAYLGPVLETGSIETHVQAVTTSHEPPSTHMKAEALHGLGSMLLKGPKDMDACCARILVGIESRVHGPTELTVAHIWCSRGTGSNVWVMSRGSGYQKLGDTCSFGSWHLTAELGGGPRAGSRQHQHSPDHSNHQGFKISNLFIRTSNTGAKEVEKFSQGS